MLAGAAAGKYPAQARPYRVFAMANDETVSRMQLQKAMTRMAAHASLIERL